MFPLIYRQNAGMKAKITASNSHQLAKQEALAEMKEKRIQEK
jgi:hypothetical protein